MAGGYQIETEALRLETLLRGHHFVVSGLELRADQRSSLANERVLAASNSNEKNNSGSCLHITLHQTGWCRSIYDSPIAAWCPGL